MNKYLILGIILVSSVFCHPNQSPLRNIYSGECSQENPAPIQSWHIHLLYWQNNNENMAGALEVRDNFIQVFKEQLGEDYLCGDDEEKDNKLCLFNANKGPVGPFLTAQWCAYIPLQHFEAVISWGLQHRNGYDTLFHPNTGCGLQDHSWWALWAGQSWQLDLSIFSHENSISKVEKEKLIADHQEKAENESILIKLFNQFDKH